MLQNRKMQCKRGEAQPRLLGHSNKTMRSLFLVRQEPLTPKGVLDSSVEHVTFFEGSRNPSPAILAALGFNGVTSESAYVVSRLMPLVSELQSSTCQTHLRGVFEPPNMIPTKTNSKGLRRGGHKSSHVMTTYYQPGISWATASA